MVRINIDWKLPVMGVFFVVFFLRECHHGSELKDKDNDFRDMESFHEKRDSVNLSKLKHHATDSIKMSQTIVEFENLSKGLKEELKSYKEGASLVEATTNTVIRDIVLEVHDTIVVDYSRIDSSNCQYADSLIKEFQNKKFFYNFKDDWVAIKGSYSSNEVLLDTISMKNEFDVILGYKKEKWYKKRDPVVELKSYSPYTEVVYVNNVVTKDNRTGYQKTFNSKPAYFIYGVLSGFILRNNLK